MSSSQSSRNLMRHVERASAQVRSWPSYLNRKAPMRAYSEPFRLLVRCTECGGHTSGNSAYPERCGGCDSRDVERLPLRPACDMDGCDRPQFSPGRDDVFRRCALHEIATYNTDDLDEWGEENAADMVRAARAQLAIEGGEGLR